MRRAKSLWDDIEPGRLDEREEEGSSLFGGRHRGLRRAMRRAMRYRANWILRGLGKNTHNAPVVVKQVSLARQKEALRRIARYIARLDFEYPKTDNRASDLGPSTSRMRRPSVVNERAARDEYREPVVYDQDGEQIPRDRVLETLETWGLLEDRDNLTSKGVDVLRIGGRSALDTVKEAEAFNEVQGRHIIVSAPMVGYSKKAVFEQIVRQFVKDTFGAWDYPAIAAIHVEHGKELHGHILVGTTNLRTLAIESIDGRRTMNAAHERFFFDYDGIVADALRLNLAEVAQRFGMNVDATRREDRMDLVFEILRGNDEIRPRPPQKQQGRERQVNELQKLPAILQRLVRRAPKSAAHFSADWVANFVANEFRRGVMRAWPEPSEDQSEKRKVGFIERLLGGRKSTRSRGMAATAIELEIDKRVAPIVDGFRRIRAFSDDVNSDRTVRAARLWFQLSCESRQFARWAIVNTPYLFGPVTSAAAKIREDEELLRLIDSVEADELADLIFPPHKNKGGKESLGEKIKMAENAVNELLTSLSTHEDIWWARKFSTDGVNRIVRSYSQLAETIEAAFQGEAPELRDAVQITDLVELLKLFRSRPVEERDIEKMRDLLGLPQTMLPEHSKRPNDTQVEAKRPRDSSTRSKRGGYEMD